MWLRCSRHGRGDRGEVCVMGSTCTENSSASQANHGNGVIIGTAFQGILREYQKMAGRRNTHTVPSCCICKHPGTLGVPLHIN